MKLPHCSLPQTRRNATYRKGRAINRRYPYSDYIKTFVPLEPENAVIWRATGIDTSTLSEKMDHREWNASYYYSKVSQHAGFHRLLVSREFSTMIRRALNGLPKMLDETYELTLLRIEKEIREIRIAHGGSSRPIRQRSAIIQPGCGYTTVTGIAIKTPLA